MLLLLLCLLLFFFKQKTAYEMRISDWSSDVCSSDLIDLAVRRFQAFSRLQRELDEAKNALAERAVIDKAKAILMKRRQIDEPAAYALLRGQAMRTNRRISEIAEAIVTSEALKIGRASCRERVCQSV